MVKRLATTDLVMGRGISWRSYPSGLAKKWAGPASSSDTCEQPCSPRWMEPQ